MDSEIRGYRLGKLRGKWCVVWYEPERKRFSLHISAKRPEAEAIAALNEFVRNREAVKLADSGPLTIENIFLAYIDDRRKEGKNVQCQRWIWNALRPTFGPLKPVDLEKAHYDVEGEQRTICHKFAVHQFERGLARDTIWNQLAYLRTALNWAFKHRLVSKKVYVWVPQKGKPRDSVIDETEFFAVLDGCRAPHIRLFVLLAISTGARKTAILQLTWTQVDFQRRIIDFRDRSKKGILDKSGQKGRSVVEFGVGLDLALREAKAAARSDFVIEHAGNQVKDVKKGLSAAVARAGLTHRKISAHVLRHSSATWLADENVDMRKIQKMLGHRNQRTTEEIYAKYRRGYLKEAASVIDLKLRRGR